MINIHKKKVIPLISIVLLVLPANVYLQAKKVRNPSFDKIKMLVQIGDEFDQKPAITTFSDDSTNIQSTEICLSNL